MCYVSSCDNEWPHLHIMPMEDILDLDTCEISNYEWQVCEQARGLTYLEFKRDFQYRELKESILKHGFYPDFAPEIRDGIVVEGHHRITVMYDISGVWCPWQEYENEDQWESNWERYVYSTGTIRVDA